MCSRGGLWRWIKNKKKRNKPFLSVQSAELIVKSDETGDLIEEFGAGDRKAGLFGDQDDQETDKQAQNGQPADKARII